MEGGEEGNETGSGEGELGVCSCSMRCDIVFGDSGVFSGSGVSPL